MRVSTESRLQQTMKLGVFFVLLIATLFSFSVGDNDNGPAVDKPVPEIKPKKMRQGRRPVTRCDFCSTLMVRILPETLLFLHFRRREWLSFNLELIPIETYRASG